jgi:hypothetical protein
VELDHSRFNDTFADRYQKLPGINQVSPVYHGPGFDKTNPSTDSFTVIGVDGDTFWDVALSRDDFAGKPLKELVKALGDSTPRGGLELPRSAKTLSVTIKALTPEPDIYLSAQVRDANDRYYSYRLGPLGFTDYLGNVKKSSKLVLATALLPRQESAEPLSLVTLSIHAPSSRERLPGGSILIDRIAASTVRTVNGQATLNFETHVVEPFDDTARWEILHVSAEAESDTLRNSSDGVNSGWAKFTWTSDQVRTTHGIVYGLESPSLPVLASQSFLDSSGYELGDEFLMSVSDQSIRVRLKDTVEFFPTMDPVDDTFLIADLTSLVRFANLDPITSEFHINEVWLSSTSTGDNRSALVERLEHDPFDSKFVADRAKRLSDSQLDPLAKSGWSALVFIAFAAALITSATGFLVHAYVSMRTREGQFALMRTIGFSVKQLIALVWIEQVLLIALGMALGTWMGGRLSRVIMPFLGHDDLGNQVVPPFIIEVDWSALAVAYSVMALLFAFIITGVIIFIRKISLQRILRIGEG